MGPAALLLLAAVLQGDDRPPAFEPVAVLEGSLPSFVSGEPGAFARVVGDATGAALLMQDLGADTEVSLRLEGSGWFLNWADFPAVARLADGSTLATWLETSEAGLHSYGTRFAVRDASGRILAQPRRLEEHDGPGEHGFVSLAALEDERFLAVWLDGREMDERGQGRMQLLARTVARDGTLGPETVVDPSTCSCCPTDLVRLTDGSFLAAWRDRTEEEVRDIAVARFDGQSWSAPRRLHDDGWQIDGCPVNGPRLAANAERTAAAWYTGVDGSVRVALGSARGEAFGRPVRVDEGGGEGRGDATFLDDGSLLVGWLEHTEGRVTWTVRRVWPDGRLGPAAELAEVSGARACGFLRLAVADGSAWALWTEPGPAPRVHLARAGSR
jgi:hypothetical protein